MFESIRNHATQAIIFFERELVNPGVKAIKSALEAIRRVGEARDPEKIELLERKVSDREVPDHRFYPTEEQILENYGLKRKITVGTEVSEETLLREIKAIILLIYAYQLDDKVLKRPDRCIPHEILEQMEAQDDKAQYLENLLCN